MDFLRKLFGKEQSIVQSSSVPPQVARLILKMSDSDPLVRMDAVKELGNLRNSRAFEVLVKVYDNKSEMGGIREAALDGIWGIKPQWLPDIRGVEIVEECVGQLVALYDKTPKGEGFIAHSASAKPVEQIGERLDNAGGFDLMVLAHRRFRQQRPRAARNLEYVWDGVGSWQG